MSSNRRIATRIRNVPRPFFLKFRSTHIRPIFNAVSESYCIFFVLTIKLFNSISKNAAMLLVPYILWVTFATFLNAGIWALN
ncbi:MAG: tryptophan-rich sensory protein [Candidatus Aenigmarchaeota archaeon]|nr:tryptophan-rich sensory protein [Candidatus Aenigmarchaeota archaeon]